MRRKTALAGGWLATTAVATAACALAVSLVTSDLTEPRRDALATADLRSIEVASGASTPPTGSERIDRELAADRAPDAARSARTFVSEGGVLVASCPDPVALLSARPNDGFQVVVPDHHADVIEVRFAGPGGTEVHLLSCDADGARVDAPPATELAGPPPEPSSTAAPPDTTGSAAAPTADEDGRRTSDDRGDDRPLHRDEARDDAGRDRWPSRDREDHRDRWDLDHDDDRPGRHDDRDDDPSDHEHGHDDEDDGPRHWWDRGNPRDDR